LENKKRSEKCGSNIKSKNLREIQFS